MESSRSKPVNLGAFYSGVGGGGQPFTGNGAAEGNTDATLRTNNDEVTVCLGCRHVLLILYLFEFH